MRTETLTAEEIRKMNAYWRAANYLSVGQMYDNPLLRQPSTLAHVKPRLLGHWGTTPDDFQGKPWAADVHVTPDGRLLDASERTSSTLAAFRINGDDGQLTLIGNYTTETQPRGFNIDPE
jgi:hypothetical protein